MTKRPNFKNVKTGEIVNYLIEEQEKAAQHKAIMFEWHSNSDGCDDCVKYNGQMFSLDNAPTTHPNCRCELVTIINGREITVSVAELSAEKYEDRKNYIPGSLSGEYESKGNPAVIGYDVEGGYSYGKYQIETKKGTMRDYIRYLKQKTQYKKFAVELENVGGYAAAILKTPSFEKKWQELAKNQFFVNSQRDFIVDKKLVHVLRAIKDVKGLNLENRHPVIKDALYSAAVQHGRAALIAKNALGGQDASDMSDEEILIRLYTARANYVYGLNEMEPNLKRNILRNRYPEELNNALNILKK